MKAYHIKYWDDVYETAATRQVRTLTYYSKPNKLVGEGLGLLLSQPDGLMLYGAFTFLEILASTAPQEWRGWLVRNGTPMDALRMSALTPRIPPEMIQRTLDFCSTPPMDWIECLEWDGASQLPLGGPKQLRTIASHQPADGTPSASHQPADGKTVRGKTDRSKTEDTEEEREEDGGFAVQQEARARQTMQFAAAQSRKRELEATPKEDRTEEQEVEFKKMRRLIRAIQQKQQRGDFTPIKEKP